MPVQPLLHFPRTLWQFLLQATLAHPFPKFVDQTRNSCYCNDDDIYRNVNINDQVDAEADRGVKMVRELNEREVTQHCYHCFIDEFDIVPLALNKRPTICYIEYQCEADEHEAQDLYWGVLAVFEKYGNQYHADAAYCPD